MALLGKGEPTGNAGILIEHLLHELAMVALRGAVQQHDVLRIA